MAVQQNILIQQLQSDGTYNTIYPITLDSNVEYDNTETGYNATNINQAFAMALRAPSIQVVYNK